MSEESSPLSAPAVEQITSNVAEYEEGGLSDVAGVGPLVVGNEPVVEESSEVVEKSETERFIDDLQTYLQSVRVADKEFEKDLFKRLQGVKPELLGATGALVEQILNQDQSGISAEVAHRSVRSILLSLGIEMKHIYGIEGSTNGYRRADEQLTIEGRSFIIRYNIENLAQIARINPEAPHILADKYGIRNFYRYSPIALVRQLEDSDRLFDDRDTQLVITAHDDKNGALKDLPNEFREDALYTRTIFAEAGSMGDVARILLTVANSKDEARSVSLERLIICAHGNKDGINLGTSDRGSWAKITKKDIVRSLAIGGVIEKGILSPSADVILAACKSGKRNGFAKIVSEKIDLDIVAADQSSEVKIENNTKNTRKSLRFDPRLRSKDTRSVPQRVGGALSRWKVRGNSSTVVYRGGRKNNVRDYTLSHRRPGETSRRLYR